MTKFVVTLEEVLIYKIVVECENVEQVEKLALQSETYLNGNFKHSEIEVTNIKELN